MPRDPATGAAPRPGWWSVGGRALVWAALCWQLATLEGAAISIRHDVDEERHLQLALDYPSVGRFGFGSKDQFGSGVLIAPRWVLLASHNLMFQSAPFTFEVGDQTHEVDWWHRHPANLPAPNSADFLLDIALAHLVRPVDGVTPAVPYEGRDEVGAVATIVGFGMPGNGLDGVPTGGKTDTKRAGRNVIDATGSYDGAVATLDRDGPLLFYDFDGPGDAPEHHNWFGGSAEPLALEAMGTSGDSGGGVFVDTPDGRRLIGINSGNFPSKSAGKDHRYGVVSRTVRVAAFTDWIVRTIARFESSEEPLIGLVAHWSFDEESGELAEDVSGTGHRGTVIAAGRSEGVRGTALAIPAGDGETRPFAAQPRVEVPNPTQLFWDAGRGIAADLKIRGDLTIAAWIWRDPGPRSSASATRNVVVAKIDPGGAGPPDFALALSGDSIGFAGGSDEWVEVESTALGQRERWMHVAVTRRSNTVTFFCDGQTVGEAELSGPFPSSDRPLLVGNAPPGQPFAGRIDELRLYDRGLPREEVRQLAGLLGRTASGGE